MNLLVTAGGTIVPVDQVRFLGNLASGRTGAALAEEGWKRGHQVTLLTSHPEIALAPAGAADRWRVVPFVTFEDLHASLPEVIRLTRPDVIIHSAAVSDYGVAEVYTPARGDELENAAASIDRGSGPVRLTSAAAGKVRSDAPEVWIRLRPVPKLIDLVREEWGFDGLLVKFKLEAGVDEARLLEIAEASRLHSRADLMVANRTEDAAEWAWIGPAEGTYRRVPRHELASRLLDEVEQMIAAGSTGVRPG